VYRYHRGALEASASCTHLARASQQLNILYDGTISQFGNKCFIKKHPISLPALSYPITTLEPNIVMFTRNMLTMLVFTAQASTHPHHLSNEKSPVSNDTVIWRKISGHHYYSNSSQLLQRSTNFTTLFHEYSRTQSQSNLTTTPCNHTQSIQLSDIGELHESASFAKVVYIACFVFGLIGIVMLVTMLVTQFLVKHCTGRRAKEDSKSRHASIDSKKVETLKAGTCKEVE